MKATFSSGANRDVLRILEYYVRQAGADIAQDFHYELMSVVDRIKRWPKAFSVINSDIRRVVLKRFPFQVFYSIRSKDQIKILAVRHHKQDQSFGLDR